MEDVRSWFEPRPLGPITEADKARFLERVGEPDANGCRRWLGSPRKAEGYCQFKLNNRTVSAHRVAKAIADGQDPGRQHVLHRCDNNWCVEPSHLFLGTNKDNVDDMIAKGRYNCGVGETHGLVVLTREQVLQIYDLAWKGHYSQPEIAKMFGVVQQHVSDIKNKKVWKHLWQLPPWSRPWIEEITTAQGELNVT